MHVHSLVRCFNLIPASGAFSGVSHLCFFLLIRLSLTVFVCHIFTILYRPSLNELRQHAFIAHNQIPGSIPSSCTYSAPLWSTDEFGELQVVNPTSALDINISNSAPAPQAKPASSAKSKFAIYDDVQSTSKPAVSNGDKLIEKLSGHVASCCIDDDEVREPPPSSTSSQDPKPSHMAAHSEEASVLERMHSNLDVCLTNFERIQNGGGKMKACAVAMVEETKWVSRFVDYTSKYGLGFLLNDGRCVKEFL